MRSIATLLIISLFGALHGLAHEVKSPNGSVSISVSEGGTYSLRLEGQRQLAHGTLGLDLGQRQAQSKARLRHRWTAVDRAEGFLYRQAHVEAAYEGMLLDMGGGLDLEVRAYDQGVALRWIVRKAPCIVGNELFTLCPEGDATAYLPHSTNEKAPLAMAYQATYDVTPIGEASSVPAFLPLCIDCGEAKLTLMESDLEDYPGMFVVADSGRLTSLFAKVPSQMQRYPWRQQTYVTATEDYIATIAQPRPLPWRIIGLSTDDRQMPLNDLVYLLASPSRLTDTSWIRPGKVAWDWWNDWGLTDVDFEAGINTQTYERYIDFAQAYGLEYVVLDEGWYDPKSGDMLTVVPAIDLPHLVSYAAERGVGLILWTVFNVLDEQLLEACKRYSALGIRGFKVDFLDRDDQQAVGMAYRIAEACAQHQLLLDYHGVYKPTGLCRTWPNVVNFESVFGMEEAKWTEHGAQDMPRYDVTFPFIRMQCGPVDFTPGGMRNATERDFQPVYANPMTMGTRAHQAAMYVVHDSPLTMLADSPTAYEREPQYTAFIASVPTNFDQTLIPLGRMGEYIVTARRKGADWYVGGQTNWQARTIELPLTFLAEGAYEATILTDGPNAHKVATDHRLTQANVNASETLTLDMASGGGFAVKLSKK